MTTDQDFPGKVTHFKHFFFISIAQWSVEEDVTITSKVAKGKGKTRGKNGKPAKWAEEQDNKSTYSFKITIRGTCWCFLYQGWYLHKEKVTIVFNVKFWIDNDFFVRNLEASVKAPLAQVAFTKDFFFLYLTEWYPFFLLCVWFFLRGLSYAFDFSTSKGFP